MDWEESKVIERNTDGTVSHYKIARGIPGIEPPAYTRNSMFNMYGEWVQETNNACRGCSNNKPGQVCFCILGSPRITY